MIKWIFIIAIALSLSGCADTADAESSAAITSVENQQKPQIQQVVIQYGPQ